MQRHPESVVEVAILEVKPGQETAFEQAFGRARSIIASTPGYLWLDLERCVETPHRYLLLVEWESIEAHTEGFRGAPVYEEWKALLHHFYESFPTVEHYRTALTDPS